MKAVFYLKIKNKLLRVTQEPQDMPDSVMTMDIMLTPINLAMFGGIAPTVKIPLSLRTLRFKRMTGMEELLGTSTFVCEAPDGIQIDEIIQPL